MKRNWWMVLAMMVLLLSLGYGIMAQCSLCTRTAQQLGPKAGGGLNAGILYLAATPLAIAGVIGFRWWKSNKD